MSSELTVIPIAEPPRSSAVSVPGVISTTDSTSSADPPPTSSSILISSSSVAALVPPASWTSRSSSSSSPLRTSTSGTSQLSGTGTISGTSASVSATASSLPASAADPSIFKLPIAAFAGATVGSFVAGALVAGLIVFVLSRKHGKRQRAVERNRYVASYDPAHSGEKGSPMVTVAAIGDCSFLPQQADDSEVRRRILSLSDQIDQHVENFYHNRKVQVNGSVEAKISRYETRQMPNPLAACFEMATYPPTLIRHCLAFHVFSQTVAPGEETQLMLPTDMVGMVSTIYHRCISPTASHDMIAAFALWKNLTGYLRPSAGRDQRSSQAASELAFSFAKQFSSTFSAWSNLQYPEEHRTQHLALLVDQAIDTGIWLFQQPDSYRFSWNTLSMRGRGNVATIPVLETVIVPEMFKATHQGVLLGGQGQTIVQAVVKNF